MQGSTNQKPTKHTYIYIYILKAPKLDVQSLSLELDIGMFLCFRVRVLIHCIMFSELVATVAKVCSTVFNYFNVMLNCCEICF